MRKIYCKYLLPCAAIAMSLSLAACGAGNEENKTRSEAVTESSAESGSDELSAAETPAGEAAGNESEETKESKEQTLETKKPETKTQESVQEKQAAGEGNIIPETQGTSLPNPMQKVDSAKDFSAIGITLELPENEEWYSDVSYTIIAGKVAQIAFYDKIAESDALVRAGAETEGDPSGIYYKFDDKKKESWSTKAEDGTQIDIALQVTEKNSDVHGVLATWTYKGTRYSLWEDDAWEQTDAVAKMAIEIAKRSE